MNRYLSIRNAEEFVTLIDRILRESSTPTPCVPACLDGIPPRVFTKCCAIHSAIVLPSGMLLSTLTRIGFRTKMGVFARDAGNSDRMRERERGNFEAMSK